MKLRVRHLPAASTEESVRELLEQALGHPLAAAEGVQLLLPISQGKPATFTKAEMLSTAYLVVASEQVAAKVHKRLQLANLLVDLAPQQTLPRTAANSKNSAAGTWQTDKEYLAFVQSRQVVKPGVTAPPPPPPTAVVSPMLAHMLRELAKRNKKLAAAAAASSSTPARGGGKPANKNKKNDAPKPKQQPKRNQSSAALQ